MKKQFSHLEQTPVGNCWEMRDVFHCGGLPWEMAGEKVVGFNIWEIAGSCWEHSGEITSFHVFPTQYPQNSFQ